MVKIGTIRYDGYYDDDTGKYSSFTYVLRSIRTVDEGIFGKNKYGYWILKETFTWGKLSKKHGHYGWLDPIPKWCRNKHRIVKGSIPYHPTKASARKAAKRDYNQTMRNQNERHNNQ